MIARGTAYAAAAVLVLSACGTGGGKEKEPAAAKKEEAPTIGVRGTIRADALGATRYVRARDECEAMGKLADTLAIGKSPVVIKDPSGRQVALGEVVSTTYETVKDGDETYVSPGICVFNFSVGQIPKETGVYSAVVPDLDIEAQFEADDAGAVAIKFEPYS